MAIVYLLHYAAPDAIGGHYLGVAADEASAIAQGRRHGHGVILAPDGQAGPLGADLVDVWECPSLADAHVLRAKLARQGSRARLCSMCNPGNGRGGGRGAHWAKKRASVRAEEGGI